uniref:TEP1-F n=1 Tax=Lygus hesperus TaxID=30085 RepID=A0A146LT42_LYGHE
MYKPGHKVQFRVLVLDPYLKPSSLNRIDVILKDGQNNRVKEWKRMEATKGVFSNEIQLSPNPVLGDWSIVVKANGKDQVKKFTVAEYVLPKFEVSVDVPQHATYANSTVPVTISAKYTFGQPVKGEATIKVRPQYTFFKEEVQENSKVIKADPIGKTEIDVVHALALEDNQYYERTILFDVAFKEDLTGKVLNGSASLKLHHARCKVDFQKIVDFLTPGEMYKTLLKISNWDDTPYEGAKNTPVRVRYGKGWADRENAPWRDYQLPLSGLIELNFKTQEETEVLNIEAEYMGVSAYDTVVKKQKEDCRNSSSLDLVVLNDRPKIGDTVEVDVFTKGDAVFLSHIVIGRGVLTEAKTKILSEGQHTMRLKIPITPNMAPFCHIVLVYITNKGELVAAEKEIKVDNVLCNFVCTITHMRYT